MTSVLLVTSPDAPDLEPELKALGIEVAGRSRAKDLLPDAARSGCDMVVAWDPYPGKGLLEGIEALQRHMPMPVLLFTSDADAGTLDAALEAGVHAYVVNGYAPQRLRGLMQLARARHTREAARRRAHEELAERFEERKLVDRAKGILMRSRQIDEDEAFRVLRAASMQSHQRVGQLAHRIIEAARDAETVNRAGLLRMLSQRVVKFQAMCCAGIDADASSRAQAMTVEHIGATFELLDRALSRATFGDLMDAARLAWAALQAELRRTPVSADGLGVIDDAAERLLESAEQLTRALEVASPLATLGIVNRAGRQRMLSQRLAKQALLAALCDGEVARRAAADAVRTVQDFESTLQALRDAPLASAAASAELEGASLDWRQMLEGMRAAAGSDGRRALALASDALLERFERLTAEYARIAQQLFRSV